MNCEAYILVGGKSSRFGSDKSLAEIGGKTLAERALGTVRGALPESPIAFVTGHFGSFDSEAERLNVPVIRDEIGDRGPVCGLHAALSNAKSEWIFLFACDLPMMTGEHISRLGEYCSDGFDAVVPEQPDGRMQPLCAFYRVAAALPAVLEVMEKDPNAAMMAVVDRLQAHVVRSEVDQIWTNLNRPEGLGEIARKLLHRDPI